MSNADVPSLTATMAAIRGHAQVGLHFHPDRLDVSMTPVAEALLRDGVYRNQFETQLSNGKLSPVRGGDRDLWENELFGGAYARTEVTAAERPKYGALDLMRHPEGPCPRFGSCCLLLGAHMLESCTFTYMDSHQLPPERGTIGEFDDILAALLTESFQREFALGRAGLRPPELLAHLRDALPLEQADPSGLPAARNLDHYIEAQVHGEISLATDVDVLIADPSFQGTQTGDVLQRLCQQYGIRLHWHCGFALPAADVPGDFRGPDVQALAKRVGLDGMVDAAAIGIAAADLRSTPDAWRDFGTPDRALQLMKLLWHVLVRYGNPKLPLPR